MALQIEPWSISKEDLAAVIATPMPSLQEDFYAKIVDAERSYVDEGVKRALSLWASELEPELMFRGMETRPFGVTAKGHGTPYIRIKWDPNFYLTGEPRRFPVERVRPRA